MALVSARQLLQLIAPFPSQDPSSRSPCAQPGLDLLKEVGTPNRDALGPLALPPHRGTAQPLLNPSTMGKAQLTVLLDAQQAIQRRAVNESIPLWGGLNLSVSPMPPLCRVPHRPCSNHVQIDVHDAPNQVIFTLHRSRVVPVFPECALSLLPLIVALCGAPRRQLETPWNDVGPGPVVYEEMNVVRRCTVVQHDKPVTLLCLVQPPEPLLSVPGELQQEFLLMAPVRDVPYQTRFIVPVRPRHTLSPLLSRPFSGSKRAL